MARKLILAVLCLVAVGGCQSSAGWQGAVKPKVTLKLKKSIWGAYALFESDKDDTYKIEKIAYNPKTGEFAVEKLDFRQDSPAVIEANTAQLAALIPLRQQETMFQAQVGMNITNAINAITQGIAIGGEAGAKLIAAGTKILEGAGFNVSTPIGGGSINFGVAPKPETPQPLERTN